MPLKMASYAVLLANTSVKKMPENNSRFRGKNIAYTVPSLALTKLLLDQQLFITIEFVGS
jgi:hypothetical protein